LRWDGRDVWPAICGEAEPSGQRLLYWKTPNASAVRSGDWKLVLANDGRNAQLYDLASDPYEKNDLASRDPARVAELRLAWTKFAAADR